MTPRSPRKMVKFNTSQVKFTALSRGSGWEFQLTSALISKMRETYNRFDGIYCGYKTTILFLGSGARACLFSRTQENGERVYGYPKEKDTKY